MQGGVGQGHAEVGKGPWELGWLHQLPGGLPSDLLSLSVEGDTEVPSTPQEDGREHA